MTELHQAPSWLLKLKPGRYTMRELIKLTKLTRANINRYLKKYGVKVEPHKHIEGNFIYYIYIWQGVEGNKK